MSDEEEDETISIFEGNKEHAAKKLKSRNDEIKKKNCKTLK